MKRWHMAAVREFKTLLDEGSSEDIVITFIQPGGPPSPVAGRFTLSSRDEIVAYPLWYSSRSRTPKPNQPQ